MIPSVKNHVRRDWGPVAAALELAAPFAAAGGEYGVCAHLHRVADARERTEECRAIAAAGFSGIRFDLSWRLVQDSPDAPFDFSIYDSAVADAEAAGLTVLPVLRTARNAAKRASGNSARVVLGRETPGSKTAFRDCTGRLLHPAHPADGVYLLTVGESPVFFRRF